MSSEFDLSGGPVPVWPVVCLGTCREGVSAIQALQALQAAFPRLTQAQLGRMIGGAEFVVARCKSKEEAASLVATLLRCGVAAKVQVPAQVPAQVPVAAPAPPPPVPPRPAPRVAPAGPVDLAATAAPGPALGLDGPGAAADLSAPQARRPPDLGKLDTVSDTFDRPLPGRRLRLVVVAGAVVLAMASIGLRTYIPGLLRSARSSATQYVEAQASAPAADQHAAPAAAAGKLAAMLEPAGRGAWDETVAAIVRQRYEAPFFPDGDRKQAQEHTDAGLAALKADPAKAAAEFREAIKADPGFAKGLEGLALAYCKSGEMAKAEPLLEQVIDMAPDRAEAWAGLTWLYAATSRGELARTSLKIAALLSTDRARFQGLLANSAASDPDAAFRAVVADVLGQLGQVPERATTALDQAPSQALVTQVMDANYGARDRRTRCWRATDEDGNGYCMTAAGSQLVDEGGVMHLYVVATGDNQRDQSHAASGNVGAFAYRSEGSQWQLEAREAVHPRGSYGVAPKPWRLAHLGPGVYGWVGQDGGGNSGYFGSEFEFLVPLGGKMLSLGLVSGESNEGACMPDDTDCTKQSPLSVWTARFAIDTSATSAVLYPLLVVADGVKDGKKLPADTVIRVPYDAAAQKYVPPAGPPFS